MPLLPSLPADKEHSLQLALSRMLAAHEASARSGDDDPHVTTVKRLAPAPAILEPFPEALDPRLQQALRARGIALSEQAVQADGLIRKAGSNPSCLRAFSIDTAPSSSAML